MTNLNDHLKFSCWNYRITELEGVELIRELPTCTRETIISWLQWNDPNSIYSDVLTIKELGSILSWEEGIKIMMR